MEEEEGNESQRAEKKNTHLNTHADTHNHRREEEKIDCTGHLKHKDALNS